MSELTTIPFASLMRSGLILPECMEIHDWMAVGHKLCQCRESFLFWIGDWINYGESTYGEKYKEAKKIFGDEIGYDEGTLRMAASVARRIPLVDRSTTLSFKHHYIVAPLERKDQKKWLALAESEKLTTAELTARIRAKLKDKSTTEENSTSDIFMFESWINEATRGFKAFPVVEWADEDLIERIEKIEAIEKPLIEEANRRGLRVAA